MNVLDLFSGGGGFSVGLERAGMRTIAFCEKDAFCRRLLERHWPGVPIFPDVVGLEAKHVWRHCGASPDVICGGFPCQDISYRGLGAGIDGLRSGLWREFARLVGDFRPSYAIVENTAALFTRGLDRILGDLAALGYDAEWHGIPACAVGAPHERDRVWIIAHTDRLNGRRGEGQGGAPQQNGLEIEDSFGTPTDATPLLGPAFFREQSDRALRSYWPETWEQKLEALRGMDDGVSGRLDGLAALGNAVVPQIPEIIGRAIMKQAHTRG